MSKLTLSLAVSAYEHVRDVASGAVPIEGIQLVTTHGPIEELLYRTHNNAEWHISELGMGSYTSQLARGEQPYLALPIYTSRVFRHSSVYVRKGAGIETPADLNGKRIGVPEWGMAAVVYVRGMLEESYGFDPGSAKWVQAGLHQPGRVDRMPPRADLQFDYTQVKDRSLCDMLLAGELDAVLSARTPEIFYLPDSPLERLFKNLHEEELGYWQRTGIFPVMHLIGLRRDVYEEHPWVVKQLCNAFEESKRRSLLRARDTAGSYYPVPLMLHAVRQAEAVAGPDFWPYGLEGNNHASLAAFLRYAYRHGVTERELAVEELFPKEALFNPAT